MARNRRSNGYWQDWENVNSEITKMAKKLGHFPKISEMRELGYSVLPRVISMHGGVNTVRKRMGYEEGEKPDGYWKNPENVYNEAKKILIKEKLKSLPTTDNLRKMGYSGFVAGACQYYPQGLGGLRKKLGERKIVRPKGYWKSWENVENALMGLKKNLGYIPSQSEIKNSDYSGLSNGLNKYHGGLINALRKLGEKEKKKENYFWQDWDNVESALEMIIKNLGHFPTKKEICKVQGGLYSAIKRYYGGLNSVKERIGYCSKQKLENMLEQYAGGPQ